MRINYFPGFDVDQMRWKNPQLKVRCRANYFTVEEKPVTVVPEKRGVAPKHHCTHCKTVRGDVTFDENPFAAEINDDHTKVWMCGECRSNSAGDI